MTLFEAKKNKDFIVKKIGNITNYIKNNLSIDPMLLNDLLGTLNELIDEYQKYVTAIRRCASENTIDVGDVKITDAYCIRDGIEYKLNLFDDIIESCSSGSVKCGFDIKSLLDKRNGLFRDFSSIDEAITRAESTTELIGG